MWLCVVAALLAVGALAEETAKQHDVIILGAEETAEQLDAAAKALLAAKEEAR